MMNHPEESLNRRPKSSNVHSCGRWTMAWALGGCTAAILLIGHSLSSNSWIRQDSPVAPPPLLKGQRALAVSSGIQAVNAGGSTIVIGDVVWTGDIDTSLKQTGGSVVPYPNCRNLSNLQFPQQLYCTLRHNPDSYTLSGFSSNLRLAVDFYLMTDETTRRFYINLQGQRKLSDWTRDRPMHTPYTLTASDVIVGADGTIVIGFENNGNPPLLAGFRVRSLRPLLDNLKVRRAAVEPTSSDNDESVRITYRPGNLSVRSNNLRLSEGLSVTIIAQSGKRVTYKNQSLSKDPFHHQPDAGATYPDTRSHNVGGWVYVSNSEVRPSNGNSNPGGVGAITFDRNGKVIDYKMLLRNTKSNCGGGKTSWGAWISGEEFPNTGRIWQVDPFGEHDPTPITMGNTNKGLFESFAYDDRKESQPRFFMTKDHEEGALRRFTPNKASGVDPWNLLTQPGVIEYLQLIPGNDNDSGTFQWTENVNVGSESASNHFPNSEGISIRGKDMYFITKVKKMMYILDLDAMTYRRISTQSRLFNGQPDQIETFVGSNLMLFTEDGSNSAGIHARSGGDQYYTILDSSYYSNETTGVALSPDKKHLYFAYQDDGVLFDVTRDDGLAFDSETLAPNFRRK